MKKWRDIVSSIACDYLDSCAVILHGGSSEDLEDELVTFITSSPEPADRIRLLGFPGAYLQTTRAQQALEAAKRIIRQGRPLNARILTEEAAPGVLQGLPLMDPEVLPKLACILETFRVRHAGPYPMEESWKTELKAEEQILRDA